MLGFFLGRAPLIFSAVPAFSAFPAGSAVKFHTGAFGAKPDHRAFQLHITVLFISRDNQRDLLPQGKFIFAYKKGA
jgi:hypothetical protein